MARGKSLKSKTKWNTILAAGLIFFNIHAEQLLSNQIIHSQETADKNSVCSQLKNDCDIVTEEGSGLETIISQKIDELKKSGAIKSDERIAIVAYDLGDHKTLVSINERVPMQTASMAKVFAMAAYFHEVSQGKIKYTDTDKDILKQMIRSVPGLGDNSNQSFNTITEKVGGPEKVQQILKTNYPEIFQNISIIEYIPLPSEKTYKNMASAADYCNFLNALWEKKLPHSEEMLHYMGLATQNYRKQIFDKFYHKGGLTSRQRGLMDLYVLKGEKGKKHPYIFVAIIDKETTASNFSNWRVSKSNMINNLSYLVESNVRKRHNVKLQYSITSHP